MGVDPSGKKLGINILLAFAPAVALGPLLDQWIESLLFGAIPVSLALIVGALLMFWAEKRKKSQDGLNGDAGKKLEDLSWKNALMIGVVTMRGNVSRYKPIYDDNCGRIFCRIIP